MRLAVDASIGKRGVKILRDAGHEIVAEAANGEPRDQFLERATLLGPDAILVKCTRKGPNRWLVELSEDGRAAASRFVLEHPAPAPAPKPVPPARVPAAPPAVAPIWPDPLRSCATKKRYATSDHAEATARILRRVGRAALRVYPCQVCDGWHLTKVGAEHAPEPSQDGTGPSARGQRAVDGDTARSRPRSDLACTAAL